MASVGEAARELPPALWPAAAAARAFAGDVAVGELGAECESPHPRVLNTRSYGSFLEVRAAAASSASQGWQLKRGGRGGLKERGELLSPPLCCNILSYFRFAMRQISDPNVRR